MLCLVAFIKYEASTKMFSATPVNQLLQSALTIGTWENMTNNFPWNDTIMYSICNYNHQGWYYKENLDANHCWGERVDDLQICFSQHYDKNTFLDRRYQCGIGTKNYTFFKISRQTKYSEICKYNTMYKKLFFHNCIKLNKTKTWWSQCNIIKIKERNFCKAPAVSHFYCCQRC